MIFKFYNGQRPFCLRFWNLNTLLFQTFGWQEKNLWFPKAVS